MTIGDQLTNPGHKSVVRVPVCVDLNNVEIAIYVHAVVGSKPGPTLALITGQHGRHWHSAEIVRRFVESLNPEEMQGSVLAVPVANPVATASRTRHILSEADSNDVNRTSGIVDKFIANQITTTLTDEVLRAADAQVTLSAGPVWAVKSTAASSDFSDKAIADGSYRLARAFGLPFIRRGPLVRRLPGMTSNFSGEVLGIPAMTVELGGTGFGYDAEENYVHENIAGLKSVCTHLGILSGYAIELERILVFPKHVRTNPTTAGIVMPALDLDDLMTREIRVGELLATVWNPYSFETVEEIRAPVRGLVDMVTPSYPVRPGDWTSMMVDLDDPAARWVEAHEDP